MKGPTDVTKPQMPQMTPEQWEALATAVDTLSSALAAVRPTLAPEPDPWPTEPLIVASVDDGGPQLLSIITRHAAVAMTSAIVRRAEHTLTNVVPVTVVPTAEWEAMVLGRGHHKAGSVRDDYLLRRVDRIIIATDALGLDL